MVTCILTLATPWGMRRTELRWKHCAAYQLAQKDTCPPISKVGLYTQIHCTHTSRYLAHKYSCQCLISCLSAVMLPPKIPTEAVLRKTLHGTLVEARAGEKMSVYWCSYVLCSSTGADINWKYHGWPIGHAKIQAWENQAAGREPAGVQDNCHLPSQPTG